MNWINVFALAEKNTYMFQKASHNNRDTENICMTTEKGISAQSGLHGAIVLVVLFLS